MELLVNIDVPDLQEGAAFYGEAFGLTIGRTFGHSAVELLGSPSRIYLLKKQEGSVGAGHDRRRYDRHWSPVHLDFVVEDIRAATTRVVAAGAKVEQPVEKTPFGYLAMFSDPFGHGFCLLEFSGDGYDAVAD